MKLIPVISTLLSMVILTGCKTAGSYANLKDSSGEWAEIPTIECQEGEPTSFALVDGDRDVKITDFDTSGIDLKGRSDLDSKASLVRLDMCMNNDVPELKQVALGHSGKYMVYNTTAKMEVQGLKEAVFDNDYSKLRISGRWTRSPSYGFVLIGSKNKPSALLLRPNYISTTNEAYLASDSQMQAGSFEFAEYSSTDPLEESTGKPAPTCSSKKYNFIVNQIGTASVRIEHCVTLVAKSFVGPTKIIVTDTHPSLPASERGKAVEITRAGKTANWKSASAHHYSCESLVINSPHAQYVFFSRGAKSSCTPLPEAADLLDSLDTGSTAWKITYPHQTPATGIIERLPHYSGLRGGAQPVK